MLWEDGGTGLSGRVGATGPLCAKDRSTLRYLESGRSSTREVRDTDYVGSYHGRLACPECGKTFLLGEQSKQVGTARAEAEARLEGRRRR